MPSRIDITGKVFGKVTVVSFHGVRNKKSRWVYRCECGVEKVADYGSLAYGDITSCGCSKKGRLGNASRTHGVSQHELYGVWKAMMARCYEPKNARYSRYGGRGIIVCERWHSIAKFIEDMHPRPEGTTLEREDNNGNYEPSNCRWATLEEQATNTEKYRYSADLLTVAWGLMGGSYHRPTLNSVATKLAVHPDSLRIALKRKGYY